jgi:hypothetical protein
VARLAHAVAIENSLITSDVIEVQEFPTLAQTYAVRGVPKTVMGTTSPLAGVAPQVQFVGAVPEAEFVDRVLQAGTKEPAKESAS